MAFLVSPLVRRVSVLAVLLGIGFIITSAGSMWHPAAQGSRAADLQPTPPTVASTGDRVGQEPRDRGATYEWLESQATRVTVRFPDVVAISERTADADLKTRLTDLVGNDLATFKVHRVDAMNDVLEFRSTDVAEIRPSRRTSSRPTLDWASRQAYSLWKDRATGASQFEWQDGLLRPRGARIRDLDREISELHTEWANGLSATASRASTRRHVMTGAPARGNSFTSRLKKDNADVGSSRWYVEEQVLAWSFPGLTEGYLDAGRLNSIGGWPFTPDLAWANVQSFAFHYFHTLVATQGFVARRENGWKEKVLGLVMPTVLANEPGCDGLHWLDRTVFRPCCDVHDRCYRRNGCSASSWWQWWSSWQCNSCNTYAVFCFATGGRAPYYQSPY
jgi:hypothetical protein